MNPSLIVLPEEYSIPDAHLIAQLKAVRCSRHGVAKLESAHIPAVSIDQVLSGRLVPTSLVGRLARLLEEDVPRR